MKKLGLKSLKLEATDMLQRNQLKSLLGGGYSATCEDDECSSNSGCTTTAHPTCSSFSCTKEDGTTSTYKSCI